MFKKLFTTLGIATLLTLSGSGIFASRASAMSDMQSYFNNPLGAYDEQRTIQTRVIADIDEAGAGDVVRIATYTLNETLVVDKLLQAFERGAKVQIVLDVHDSYNSDVARLKTTLGTDVNSENQSWIKVCRGSCRGIGAGVLHSKIYLFSKSQAAYIGSANLSGMAIFGQWNEMVRFQNTDMFNELNAIFDEMKLDVYAGIRPAFESGNYKLTTYPRPLSKDSDPLLEDLNKISCTGAQGLAGSDGRTVILISQYALNGKRGLYLAKKLASLKRHGCIVRAALGGKSSRPPKSVLVRAGILQASRGSVGGGTTSRYAYNHEKWMAISGVFEGNPTSFVLWTGSMNWSENEWRRDNVSLRVKGDREMFDAYVNRMNQLKR